MKESVPVTLLTGFLGAGKTTLLNGFLRSSDNAPVAIVENEFGAANIDGALLNMGDNVRLVELSNGCVCCSVRGEFTAALHALLDSRESGNVAFGRLIVETTGLADPAPIIQSFFVDDRLRESLQLDAVITLVNAQHIQRHLDEHPVAVSQVGFADRILLTHADTLAPDNLDPIVARLHRINAKAEIYQVTHGECSPSLWLGLKAFVLSDGNPVSRGLHIVEGLPAPRFMPFKSEGKKPRVNDDITSVVLEAGWLDLHKAGEFMSWCVDTWGQDMLRYKGILAIAGRTERLVVQGIHNVVGFDDGSPWRDDESASSRLVIIGRRLPWDEIRQRFAAACV